ncbi:MAG: hypothetical protein LBE79_13110 [Tannerella sp.]|jgi:hypothetical protein|nr:hypothetical protein [Tannerella sp.]
MNTFCCEIWQEITVSFIGAFFGFGFALFIEHWIIYRDKKKEKQAFKEEMDNKIEYFKKLLEDTRKKSNEQVELIQQNIKQQSKNYLYPVPLKYIFMNCFIRLKNIDLQNPLNMEKRLNICIFWKFIL